MIDFKHLLWHLLHPRTPCGSPEPGGVISDVGLQRQMLYDAFQNPEEVAQAFGLPSISPELAEMEHKDHLQRLTYIGPVIPLLLTQAQFMAQTAALLQLTQAGKNPVDHQEEHVAYQIAFTNIITVAVISSVSTAVGMGALDVLKGVHVEQ